MDFTEENRIKYFNQLISDDEARGFIENKKNIALTGGCGTGKTTFIKDKIVKNAERILYYCPRNQLKDELSRTFSYSGIRNIDFKSTQSFETIVIKKYANEIDFAICYECSNIIEKYDVVVFDEVHTIFTDAKFNNYTDYTYKLLMELMKAEITVILISATGDIIFSDLKKRNLLSENDFYTITTDYSYLSCTPLRSSSKCIYNKISELLKEESEPNEKIIYFTSNINNGIEIKKQIESEFSGLNITFAVSRHSRRKLKNGKSIQEINEIDKITNTFTGKLLICTTALDVGISLTDKNIKYIVTDIYNTESLIQCISRRRSESKSDRVNLYFRNWHKNGLQGAKNKAYNEINQINLFNEDRNAFHRKYERKENEITRYIYYNAEDKTWKYNEVGEIQLVHNIQEYEDIEEYSLANILNGKLFFVNMCVEYDTSENLSNTREKLFELVNKKIYIKDKDIIVNTVKLVEDRARNRHPSRDFETLKAYIWDKYKLELAKEREPKTKKTYWILLETEYTFEYARKIYGEVYEYAMIDKWEKVFEKNLNAENHDKYSNKK